VAAPSFRAAGTQTNSSSGTSISVPAPSGHQAGDLLILVVAPFVTFVDSTPSGWTLMSDSLAWGGSSPDSGYRTFVYRKFAASSSEPNVTITLNSSNFANGQMFAIQGDIDTGTPIDVAVSYGAVDTDTTIPTPAVTTATNSALVVYIGQDQGGNTWTTPPTGATQRVETTVFITKTIWADFNKTTAGTVAADNYTRGATSGHARVLAFAVRPIVAAAPVANFTGTPLSGTASLSVTFTDSSTNTPTSWAWNFGDGSTSTSQNPTHSYTTSGVYTVTLVASNTSGSDTKTRTNYVTVNEAISYASGGGITIW
jgi:PKD repeat protein